MNYSVRVLSAVKESLKSSVDTIKETNKYRRIIKQTWKEVEKTSEKYCKVIPLPSIVKQLNIKGKDLKNEEFINKQSKEEGKFDKFNKDIKSLNKESIMSKIIDLQFHIDKDTFIECEHHLEIMRNAPMSV